MTIVVCNGVTYTGDAQARTVTPDDATSRLVQWVLGSGDPLGLTDEFAGVTASWDGYPRSMIGVFLALAAEFPDDYRVTWYADDGTPPPDRPEA